MIRKVAQWFHDREGELFTVDETPFTREEIVQLVDDSVDPVQQVMVDREKYVGVISFEEHDGWYEYTRWSDTAGEVNIGVCAKCVQEAEYVDEVSRTIGDSTDVARQKFNHHYEQDHEVRPDEVNTGATLLSGTTINGNTAIHPGMDGSGSGVDADFVLGNEALQAGSFYSFSDLGNILSKFTAPSNSVKGVGTNSNDSIWHSNNSDDSIYKTDQTGSVIKQFSATSNVPSGIDCDSTDSVWHANTFEDSIYQFDESGTTQQSFASPCSSPTGLGVDSNECVWVASTTSDSIYQVNQSGTTQSKFNSPSISPVGVGLDSNDSIWHSDGNHDSIFELDQSGTELSKFSTPSNVTGGVGVDSKDSIWHGQTLASIYEMYPPGGVIQF